MNWIEISFRLLSRLSLLALRVTFKQMWSAMDIVQRFLQSIILQNLHWQTKEIFFPNVFEMFTYSEAYCRPKHKVAFRFSLNQTVLPWLYVENSIITKLAVTLFIKLVRKYLISKRFRNFNILWIRSVSITQCYLQTFPRPYCFSVTLCWNFKNDNFYYL